MPCQPTLPTIQCSKTLSSFYMNVTYCSIAACCPIRYDVPLVADIHFQPAVAMMVADAFEKIRINPGNFADGRKTFEVINYDDPKQVGLTASQPGRRL